MVLGALAGIGASLYGASRAKKAQDKANRGNIAAKNAARGEIIGGRDAYMRQSSLGLAHYLDALEEAGVGEAKAAGEITRGTSKAARGIMDQDAEGMAAVGGNFANRGLFGSSLLDQARTGVRRATGRSLIDLEGSSAMARAQLARSSSQSKMGALSQLGGFEERRAGTLFDTGRYLADLEAGVQHQVDPNIASGYGQLAGLLSQPLDDLWGNMFGEDEDEDAPDFSPDDDEQSSYGGVA
jgi:hypothetical protein